MRRSAGVVSFKIAGLVGATAAATTLVGSVYLLFAPPEAIDLIIACRLVGEDPDLHRADAEAVGLPAPVPVGARPGLLVDVVRFPHPAQVMAAGVQVSKELRLGGGMEPAVIADTGAGAGIGYRMSGWVLVPTDGTYDVRIDATGGGRVCRSEIMIGTAVRRFVDRRAGGLFANLGERWLRYELAAGTYPISWLFGCLRDMDGVAARVRISRVDLSSGEVSDAGLEFRTTGMPVPHAGSGPIESLPYADLKLL